MESEVADRLVMRCGRELHAKRDLPFEFSPAKPERVCFYCGLAERLGRYVGGPEVVER